MGRFINVTVPTEKKRLISLLVVIVSVAASVWLFDSKGTVDARNWEVIFQDILTLGPAYIPDCLNYLCPSNIILTKFPLGHALIFYMFSLVFPVKIFGILISMKALILIFYVATLGAVVWFGRQLGSNKRGIVSDVVLYLSMFSLIEIKCDFFGESDGSILTISS